MGSRQKNKQEYLKHLKESEVKNLVEKRKEKEETWPVLIP